MLGRVRFSLSPLVLIVLTIVLVTSSAFAQASGIHGTVLNSAGAPLEGATVRLIENGIERARATSDEHGRFTLATACSRPAESSA